LSRKDVVDRISSSYGITKTTVYQWYKGQTPFGRRAGRIARVPELLYVLGALLGDGCIYHWRNLFQIWLVGEEAFTAKFALKLSQCIGRKVKNYRYGSKSAWFVRVENAELYFLFQSIRSDHSLVQRIIEETDPVAGWDQFIEGFFDAEGCVKIIRGRERKTPKACLDFCNTDYELLELVRRAMSEQFGIESGMSIQAAVPPRKTVYHLRIYSKEGIAKFLSVVHTTKLTADRKKVVDVWLSKRR
jgi:intein-encoded DNA endonuclease-like protein